MTDDRNFRQQVHQAVEAYSTGREPDPYLMQRVLARAEGKEGPLMKKKLSAAAILVLALLLLSVTALGVGLTLEEIWQQSFEKMNTSGWIHNLSDETLAEISMEEAIAIARDAIIAKYGTPESELDAMGVYPTYAARGWDGMTDDEPSEWDIYLSSRTDVYLDRDYTDYGPTGEYRVYINAETREVTYCHWYTNDFWSRAQTIWDCGSHDEVYWHYRKQAFYTLPMDTQTYWTSVLASAGYEVVAEDEKLHTLLLAADTDLQFCELSAIADNADPQVAAAWAALEERCGLDAQTLQKYAFVATRPDWQTGTDNICIHYSYELEWDMTNKGFLNTYSDWLFDYATHFGLYMVSFEPGTTQVAAMTHVTRGEATILETVTEGKLLDRTDWTAADLAPFDAAYEALDRAVKRMTAAGLAHEDITVVIHDYLRRFGQTELYHAAPADVDTASWFAEESEWDAHIIAPALTYEEFGALYGPDERFWPMEVLSQLMPRRYRMPLPGETTLEEAAAKGVDFLVFTDGKEALEILGDYQVFCRRVSLTADPDAVDCRWEVFIVSDPANPIHGWKITWGEWSDHTSDPSTQHITDNENG